MSYHKSQENIENDTEKTIDIIESRGHIYVKGIYQDRKSTLIVYCPIHEIEYTTTFYNYKRAKTGLDCCGNQLVSEKLIGREYTDETIKRMSEGAYNRPLRGGLPRFWRKTSPYLKWKNNVFQSYNNECAVTGLKKDSSKGLILIAHHFYNAKEYPALILVENNGIVLEQSIHVLFHNTYGYRNNTLLQFKTFLSSPCPLLKEKLEKMSMPISSQAKSEDLEGSETRAYDPDRVMKLHERLESLDLPPPERHSDIRRNQSREGKLTL